MKKAAVVLILCLATTASFAQKKNKVERGNEKSEIQIEYMVIRCLEQNERAMDMERMGKEELNDPRVQQKMAMMMFEETSYQFNVLGDPRNLDREMMEMIEMAQTPSEALNAAGDLGWELETSYAVTKGSVIAHYYNFAREK